MKKTKPKSNKSAKKGANTSAKKVAKKELESGIAERFLDVVSNLGHDAERIAKDIKKMSKEIAKKLSEKMKSSKKGEKLSVGKRIKADKVISKRDVKASKKDVVKPPSHTEKVAAAAKPAAKPAVRRTPQITSSSIEEAPKRRRTRSVPAGSAAKSKDEAKAPAQKRTRRPVAPKMEAAKAPLVTEAPEADKINVVENQESSETVETKSE